MHARSTFVWLVVLAMGGPACASSAPPPHNEDAARATVPIPACVAALAPRPHADGTVRNLEEDEIWKLVFPRYDARTRKLPADAVACTGERIFSDEAFRGGKTRDTAPASAGGAAGEIDVREGDVSFGNAGDRIRIVWLRTHSWPDGTEAGPLALVRANDVGAELYAIGVYRGRPQGVTLETERLGTAMLIAVADDGCGHAGKASACTSRVTLHAARFGRLEPVATLVTERRDYASGTEPGVFGQLEYHLTASPEYSAGGVRLVEQVQATDSAGHVLRKTELERSFVLRDGALEGPRESLWDRIYPRGADRVRSPAAKSAPDGGAPERGPPAGEPFGGRRSE